MRWYDSQVNIIGSEVMLVARYSLIRASEEVDPFMYGLHKLQGTDKWRIKRWSLSANELSFSDGEGNMELAWDNRSNLAYLNE